MTSKVAGFALSGNQLAGYWHQCFDSRRESTLERMDFLCPAPRDRPGKLAKPNTQTRAGSRLDPNKSRDFAGFWGILGSYYAVDFQRHIPKNTGR
jgi:hypothetical protein